MKNKNSRKTIDNISILDLFDNPKKILNLFTIKNIKQIGSKNFIIFFLVVYSILITSSIQNPKISTDFRIKVGIIEAPIETNFTKLNPINMNYACEFLGENDESLKDILEREFPNKKIVSIKAVLRDSEEFKKEFAPVFHWACEIQIENNIRMQVGIPLERYCKKNQSPHDKRKIKPFYEENTWYCVPVPGHYLDNISLAKK